MNSRKRLHRKKKSTPLIQRPPIIDISSSSSSCSDKSVECSSLQNSSKKLDFHSTISSSDDSEIVYDWLATLNQSMTLSSSSLNRATTTPSHTVSTPTAKTASTLNFSPPPPLHLACKESGFDTIRAVKDTTQLKKEKFALPPTAPDVKKGTWLTHRTLVNDYLVLSPLGKGSYGDVHLVKQRRTSELFALKEIRRKKKGSSANTMYIRNEIEIMKRCSHVNVVRLFEVIDDPRSNNLYLVIEYMEKGDLMAIIKEACVSYQDARDILLQLISGLNHLHDNNIIHGDIKPSNLLLNSDGRVKLSDFGLSQIKENGELVNEFIGTPAFASPEVVKGSTGYDGKLSDWYSVGATLYCVKFGTPPFSSGNRMDLFDSIMNSEVSFPHGADNSFKDLLQNLMSKDPQSRMTGESIIHHPFVCNRRQIDEHIDYMNKN